MAYKRSLLSSHVYKDLPCSAPAASSQLAVFFFHTTPTAASSHEPANSVFLSHHSSSSLQHQHSEQGQSGGNQLLACSHVTSQYHINNDKKFPQDNGWHILCYYTTKNHLQNKIILQGETTRPIDSLPAHMLGQ